MRVVRQISLQNGAIPLIPEIWKIGNIHFVGNLILSTSCEFYEDDVTVTSFINIKCSNVALKLSHNEKRAVIFYFMGKKTLMQIRFTLRCTQCMATSILQSEQYKFGVRKFYMGRNLHQIPRCNKLFISGSDCSQFFLHWAFRNLLTHKTKNVWTNLDDILKRNNNVWRLKRWH